MTRQDAWERYRITTRVYRQGFKPFENAGRIKLVVRCPKTFVSCETAWLPHDRINAEFDRIVQQTVFVRQNLPPPPKPVRFHQPFDF